MLMQRHKKPGTTTWWLGNPAFVLLTPRMRNSFFWAAELGDFSLITNKITEDTHATKSSLFIVAEKGGERHKILCPGETLHFVLGIGICLPVLLIASSQQQAAKSGSYGKGNLVPPQKGVTEQWRLGTVRYNVARCQSRSNYRKISN